MWQNFLSNAEVKLKGLGEDVERAAVSLFTKFFVSLLCVLLLVYVS